MPTDAPDSPGQATTDTWALQGDSVSMLRDAPIVRPLAEPYPCQDRRYPALAGAFVIECGPGGDPDRVLDLSTGTITVLEQPADVYAQSDGQLYALGAESHLWTLPLATPTAEQRVVDAVTPPVLVDDRVAYGSRAKLSTTSAGSKVRYDHPASPAPWFAPAIAGPWTVWAEVHDGDFDLMGLQGKQNEASLFAGGPGGQFHVVGDRTRLAWVDRGQIVVVDTELETRFVTQANLEAGAESGPALSGWRTCWEDREAVIQCRGEAYVKSIPGRAPSLFGPLLLVQTDDGAMLYIDRDWRAEAVDGAVDVRAWWGRGRVTLRDNGVDLGQVDVTPGQIVRVPVPGNAVTIVPDDPLPMGLR